jgi:hypothetical protein
MKNSSRALIALMLFLGKNAPVEAHTIMPVQSTTPVQLSVGRLPLPVRVPVIPARTAIVVRFPQEQTVDVGISKGTPLTLPLAQPIYDTNGNQVVPADAIAVIEVHPVDGGAVLIARSLIVRGQVIEISATSAQIPGQVVTRSSATKVASETAPSFTKIGGTLLGLFSGGTMESMEQGSLLGSTIGALSGLSAPDSVRLVQFPANSLQVLALQEAVYLSYPGTETSAR